MKPILDFSKEVYQWEMRKYPGLNDQTIISIPRSGLVQKSLTFTNSRTHQGKRCQGRIPMQTYIDSLDLVKQKNLDNKNAQVFDTCQL